MLLSLLQTHTDKYLYGILLIQIYATLNDLLHIPNCFSESDNLQNELDKVSMSLLMKQNTASTIKRLLIGRPRTKDKDSHQSVVFIRHHWTVVAQVSFLRHEKRDCLLHSVQNIANGTFAKDNLRPLYLKSFYKIPKFLVLVVQDIIAIQNLHFLDFSSIEAFSVLLCYIRFFHLYLPL